MLIGCIFFFTFSGIPFFFSLSKQQIQAARNVDLIPFIPVHDENWTSADETPRRDSAQPFVFYAATDPL